MCKLDTQNLRKNLLSLWINQESSYWGYKRN